MKISASPGKDVKVGAMLGEIQAGSGAASVATPANDKSVAPAQAGAFFLRALPPTAYRTIYPVAIQYTPSSAASVASPRNVGMM